MNDRLRLWQCPDCPWAHTAHPTYGWSAHDDRAVEVHRTMLCRYRVVLPNPTTKES